jgi:AcrR family transcriptional regulator
MSREQVIEAALHMVTTTGYDELTMSGLASYLGVAPMSLYRHVTDKDDLLNEVVDRLLAPAWKPTVSRDDWRAWVIQAADKFRRFLVGQPAALHVYLSHPVVSATAVARMTTMMDVLRGGLADEQAARRAYAAIHTYTLGFAALEAGRAGWKPDASQVDGLARELAGFTRPKQFSEGLQIILDGIAR